MNDIATIGRIIRNERKGLGLRQDELAAASRVGLRFLVELERGKPTVQVGKVLDVLAALGCTLQISRPDGKVIECSDNDAAPSADEWQSRRSIRLVSGWKISKRARSPSTAALPCISHTPKAGCLILNRPAFAGHAEN